MAVKTIEWKNDRVIMLDQRLLPHKEVYRVYRDYQGVAEAIRSMVIRGAPAIGVAAAMGVAVGALKAPAKTFDREFERIISALGKTRPTAVNLFWALQRMRNVYSRNPQPRCRSGATGAARRGAENFRGRYRRQQTARQIRRRVAAQLRSES